MVQWLNKILLLFLLLPFAVLAQDDKSGEQDYKDKDQHERFLRRRKAVAAWQINKLRKSGAIVVRLRSNQLAINGLLKSGKKDEALRLAAQTFAINKNTMMAYIENFSFCKVYFIYGNASDSLLKGHRKGFFLDTNLQANDAIEMTESYYILAERDYVYNSSIGFVPESQALSVTEKGNAIKQMAIVLKNKYGHQLKNPMPHEVRENSSVAEYNEPYTATLLPNGQISVNYIVNRRGADSLQKELPVVARKKNPAGFISIPKYFMYFKLAEAVSQLDADLRYFYQRSPAVEDDKILPEVKPYLY